MDGSVAPVVRGEFLFRDVLLVDVGGELKRHPRASEGEIKRYLEGKESKDQVAHWYEAQLVHYGLQRSKDKNTAKVRLQQALNQKKLKTAPPHLVDMEVSMKREFAAAVRKTKTPSKPQATTGKGTKRARDEEKPVASSSKKTKVSVQVGDVTISVDQSPASTAKKSAARAKATPVSKLAKQSTTNDTPARSAARTPTPFRAAEPSTSQSSNHQPPSTPRDIATPPSRPKQHARKSVIGFGGPPSSQRSRIKPEPFDESSEYDSTSKPSSAPTPCIKPEPNQHHATPPAQVNITGVYNIVSDQISDQDNKLRLFLCVDKDNDKIWGAFEFGWQGGTIKIDHIATDKPLSFGWRARDYEKPGSMRFGKGCFGEIEFFGNQEVKGVFHNLFPETVHFGGQRRSGPLWSGKSAYAYEKEWDGYVKEAYGR